MLINSSRLAGCPILSLQVGGPVATVTREIIDPRKLKIVGFFLVGPEVNGDTGNILRAEDSREFSNLGMIVDSSDIFTNEGEVKKLDEVIALEFSMDGVRVETKKGTKLGKVKEYTVDTTDFRILQITVKRPIMKSLIDPELIISRKEIVEIKNDIIIVKDEEEKLKKKIMDIPAAERPEFVNPFRENGRYAKEK